MVDSASRTLLRLEMLSQPRLLAGVRAMIDHIARRLGFDENDSSQISLAVDEALCNIINHGYGKREDGMIWLTVSEEGDQDPASRRGATSGAELRIVIEDRARQVEPESIKPRRLEDVRPGGLGVHIIREVMDEALYEKRDGDSSGMRLTMRKTIPRDAARETESQMQ